MATNEPREQGNGIRVALRRKQADESLKALARATGIPAGHLSMIERGLRPVSPKTAKILGEHYGIRPSYFMGTE